MHELSIAQGIIDIVRENVPEEKTLEIKIIRVKIGKLTNILVDTLIFGFDALIKDTDFAGTKLEIEHLPIVVECDDCGEKSSFNNFSFSCPICDSSAIKIISGNELMVSEIELED
jgi:hydrogenase nickel incorporation protein HypA/HybF